jgi:hypothetical protein
MATTAIDQSRLQAFMGQAVVDLAAWVIPDATLAVVHRPTRARSARGCDGSPVAAVVRTSAIVAKQEAVATRRGDSVGEVAISPGL